MIKQRPIVLLVSILLLTIACIPSFPSPSFLLEPTPIRDSLVVPGVMQIQPPRNFWVTGLVWSPDSSKLAISYYRISMGSPSLPTTFQIQIMDIHSGELQLIEESAEISELQMSSVSAWLPDNHIAFFARVDQQEGTWQMHADGGGPTLLVMEDIATSFPLEGQRIAFWDSKQNPQTNSESILVRDLTSGTQQQVFSLEAKYTSEGVLEWSPDGGRLLFVLGSSRVSKEDMYNNIDVYVVDLASTEVIKLTEGGGHGSVSWSPDGTLIAYTFREETQSGKQNRSALYVMRSQGSCSVRIVEPGDHDVYDVSWSPDGRWIAFAWNRGIYLLDTVEVFGKDFEKYYSMCP